jgi:hypothetical protein
MILQKFLTSESFFYLIDCLFLLNEKNARSNMNYFWSEQGRVFSALISFEKIFSASSKRFPNVSGLSFHLRRFSCENQNLALVTCATCIKNFFGVVRKEGSEVRSEHS